MLSATAVGLGKLRRVRVEVWRLLALLACTLLLLCLSAAAALIQTDSLLLVNEEGKTLDLITGVERFTLRFTHSMYGGFVEEDFIVGPNGRLIRTAARTERVGAAEYYARAGNYRPADGYWVVDVEPMELRGFTLHVDSTGSPTLDVNGRVYRLQSLLPSGDVEIAVDRRPFASALLSRAFAAGNITGRE